MVAGIPVPPELLLPIKKGFDSISASILQHQNGWGCLPMGFGRKADPEPGRCRRTDGKKWRCSKDAFPDSKYCERHMHRGRNRSRKHVELNGPSSTTRPSSSSSSSLLPTNHHCVSFQALHGSHSSISPLTLDTGSYYSSCKGYRYSHALKEDSAEDAFISKGLDSSRSTDEWSLMPLKLGTLDLKKERDGSMFQNDITHLVKPKDISRQQQHCYLSRGFMGDQSESVKEERVHDVQPLRCFFDEWPKDRDSWSGLNGEHHQSSEKSLSTTQLSISIPMTSSDFSLAHT